MMLRINPMQLVSPNSFNTLHFSVCYHFRAPFGQQGKDTSASLDFLGIATAIPTKNLLCIYALFLFLDKGYA